VKGKHQRLDHRQHAAGRRRCDVSREASGASAPSSTAPRPAPASSLLFLALVAMATPTLIKSMHERDRDFSVRGLSIAIAALLLAMYALSLFFQLRTHAELAGRRPRRKRRASPKEARVPGFGGRLMLLAGAGLATAVSSEVLVSALEGALVVFKLPEAFVGVVIVAIAGNAAEHSTAVTLAYKASSTWAWHCLGVVEADRPLRCAVLVLFAVAVGAPLDLAFRPFEVAAVAVAVIATALGGARRRDQLAGRRLSHLRLRRARARLVLRAIERPLHGGPGAGRDHGGVGQLVRRLLRAMLAGGAQSAASPLLLLAARMTLATVLLLARDGVPAAAPIRSGAGCATASSAAGCSRSVSCCRPRGCIGRRRPGAASSRAFSSSSCP